MTRPSPHSAVPSATCRLSLRRGDVFTPPASPNSPPDFSCSPDPGAWSALLTLPFQHQRTGQTRQDAARGGDAQANFLWAAIGQGAPVLGSGWCGGWARTRSLISGAGAAAERDSCAERQRYRTKAVTPPGSLCQAGNISHRPNFMSQFPARVLQLLDRLKAARAPKVVIEVTRPAPGE